MQSHYQTLNPVQSEIVKALLYFDVFKYPLTKDELYENSNITISKPKFEEALNWLIEHKVIQYEEGFVMTWERTASDIIRRLKGNEGASKILPTVLQYSKKISKFPFVECVCISGSISKNYYDENSDIDYFIITKPNRLWLCRTFLILYYKLLPKSKKKLFCTNYFITSNNLVLPDVNEFTGTELAYLIPTVNFELYKKLAQQNSWYESRFPNKPKTPGLHCIEPLNPFSKKAVELIFFGWFGNYIDNKLLDITLYRWRKKYPLISDEDFDLQFRTRKDVCKRHSHGFQNKVIKQWHEKLSQFQKRYTLYINP